jgi:molybdenum cofactor cytidylyltransferase
MIVAVVLSAGESSRMGRPKALLPIDGQTFIERIVAALKQTKVGKIIVILGHNARELEAKISHLPVQILINTDYKQGQLSSLQLAVRDLQADADCDGMLVHLVDHPYLAPALVQEMIRRFYETKKRIIVPRYPWQTRSSGDFFQYSVW